MIAVDEVETKTWGQVQLSLAERLGDSGVIRLSLYDLESDSPIKLEVPIASWHKDATEPNLLQSLGVNPCLLYTSPSPRARTRGRMPSSA